MSGVRVWRFHNGCTSDKFYGDTLRSLAGLSDSKLDEPGRWYPEAEAQAMENAIAVSGIARSEIDHLWSREERAFISDSPCPRDDANCTSPECRCP